MSVTLAVSNFERSSVVRPLQPMNMEDMSVTLAVSNFERSSVVRTLHSQNIQDMSVTLAVSKPETSSVVRPLQPMNMEDMFITLAVSNFERSSDVRPLQLLNMSLMSVTLEVSSLLRPCTSASLLQPLNHPFVVVGWMPSSSVSTETCSRMSLYWPKTSALSFSMSSTKSNTGSVLPRYGSPLTGRS